MDRVGVVMTCLAAVVLSACADARGTGEGVVVVVGEEPVAVGLVSVPARSDSGVSVSGGGWSEPDTAAGSGSSGVGPVRLLTEPIPPCVPLDGVDHTPCGPGVPPGVETGGSSSIPSYRFDPPSVEMIMSGLLPQWVTHIVVRATVRPASTRCEGYLDTVFSYRGAHHSSGGRMYWCFVDVRVNEYLVGEGPTELTVGVHRSVFLDTAGRSWEVSKDIAIEYEFGNPAVGTAAAYEGREVVLFLKPTDVITVEAWTVFGHYDVFFVVEDTESGSGQESDTRGETPDGTTGEPRYRAVSRWGGSVISDVTLDELVTSVKAAAAARTTPTPTGTTTSTTGSDQTRSEGSTTTAAESTSTTVAVRLGGPPFLVTRADRLRDFYIAGGAIYEGENKTTVLPPVVVYPPTKPLNVAVTPVGDQWFVTWEPPASGGEVESYHVSVGAADHTQGQSFYVNMGTALRYEITYVIRYVGDEFRVKVHARNSAGDSEWSDELTMTTPTTTTTVL